MEKKYQLKRSLKEQKLSIFSSMILKNALIRLFEGNEGKKIFFLISKSSISNVNANLINRRERYDNNEDVCEWSRYADVIKRDITKLEDSWRIQFYYCNAWPSFIKEYKTGNLCTAHGSGIYCAYYINDPRYRF